MILYLIPEVLEKKITHLQPSSVHNFSNHSNISKNKLLHVSELTVPLSVSTFTL